MTLFCPRCGENSVVTEEVDSQEHYYENNFWLKTRHKCTNCHANFQNYDDGYKERNRLEEEEIKDKLEYERLKKKFGDA